MTPYDTDISLNEGDISSLREKERIIERILISHGFREVLLPLLYEPINPEHFGSEYEKKLLKTVAPFTGRTFFIRGDFTPIFVSKVVPKIKGRSNAEEKIFYRGEIVRVDPVRKELMWDYQVGAEWIGDVQEKDIINVICEIASAILGEFVLFINHIRIIEKVFKKIGIEVEDVRDILLKRDISYFKDRVNRTSYAVLKNLLIGIGGREMLNALKDELREYGCSREIEEIEAVANVVSKGWGEDKWRVDFGNLSDFKYHRGLFFEVISPKGVFIKGGRYDELFREYECDIKAIGFGIYLLGFLKK